MALNGLCHVKQAPSVNYLAKALAFLEQFIPAWAEAAPACHRARGSARAPPHCCTNPLKLNQIGALPSKNKCFVVAFAQARAAEAAGAALTKTELPAIPGPEGGGIRVLNNPASFMCRLALRPFYKSSTGADAHFVDTNVLFPICLFLQELLVKDAHSKDNLLFVLFQRRRANRSFRWEFTLFRRLFLLL